MPVEVGRNLPVNAVRAARRFRPVGSLPPLPGDGQATERSADLLYQVN